MKRSCLLIAFVSIAALSCKKTSSTTNNTIGNTTKPEFLVNGLTDITFVNDYTFYNSLNLTVQYEDSAQETVALSVSGLPAGITMDTTWVSSGLPTFATSLTLLDTTAAGAKPGTYPLTFTAVTASGVKRSYSFNVIVQPMPSAFLGKYTGCSFPCSGSSATYTDSVYADPSVPNKVWFTNFGNMGASVYALVTVNTLFETYLTLPAQSVAGSIYSGTANINLTAHNFGLNMSRDSVAACTLRMR